MRKRKVVVVDDSAFMRKAITRIIHSDEHFKVVATARNGIEALEMLPRYKPDVVTLDVEMPKMNGLDTLKEIQKHYLSIPVVMVSSITRFGTDIAIRCLEIGAFDVVRKPESYVSMDISKISANLISKLKAATNIRVNNISRFTEKNIPTRFPQKVNASHPSLSQRVPPLSITSHPEDERYVASQRVITIGSSTGGPKALHKILSQLPPDIPAGIVIVQHMPQGNFIQSLTERLNNYSQLEVRVAREGDIIKNGLVLVGEIGKHIVFKRRNYTYKIHLTTLPKDTLHCPAIDVLFESAGEVVGRNNISCILTGMGFDGTRGLEVVHTNHGYVIAESEESCVVYGMPRSAVEAGWVNKSFHLNNIPRVLLQQLCQGSKKTTGVRYAPLQE